MPTYRVPYSFYVQTDSPEEASIIVDELCNFDHEQDPWTRCVMIIEHEAELVSIEETKKRT